MSYEDRAVAGETRVGCPIPADVPTSIVNGPRKIHACPCCGHVERVTKTQLALRVAFALLQERRYVTRKDLTRIMLKSGAADTKGTAWNVVDGIVRRGILVRTGYGMYGLP